MSDTFALRLNHQMELQGLSLADLAQRSKVPKSSLARYASRHGADARGWPPLDTAINIANALGVSVYYLAGESGDYSVDDTKAHATDMIGLPATSVSAIRDLTIGKNNWGYYSIGLYTPGYETLFYAENKALHDYEPDYNFPNICPFEGLNSAEILSLIFTSENVSILDEFLNMVRQYTIVHFLNTDLENAKKREEKWLDDHPKVAQACDPISQKFPDMYVRELKRIERNIHSEMVYLISLLIDEVADFGLTKTDKDLYHAVVNNMHANAERLSEDLLPD